MKDIKRSTYYVSRELDDLFEQICDREGSNKSEKIRLWILDYVNDHYQGNPQTLLQRHFDPTFKKCQKCGGKFGFVNKVEYISELVGFLCDACLSSERKRDVVKKVICKV
jgi:hypothetical protein